MQHITTNLTCTISPQAVELIKTLCECAENTHHSTIARHDIIEKMAALDRGLVNQCHEDLIRISNQTKTHEPNTNQHCAD